jgi:hypothetical protein
MTMEQTVQELIKKREEATDALNQLIRQGEVLPPEERDGLSQSYQEIWDMREALTAQIQQVAPAQPPATRQQIAGGQVLVRKRVRWGVLVIGGLGAASLLGLIGWQLYRVHGRRKTRKKKSKK